MIYDDFEIKKRLFGNAFNLLPTAVGKTEREQEGIWAVVRFFAGMIGRDELRRLRPEEADEFIEHVEKIKESMIHPAMMIPWSAEFDLMSDRDSLKQEIKTARREFDFFCKQVMVARDRIGGLTTKSGISLESLIDFPTKPFRQTSKREVPFETWQQCIEIWWRHEIKGEKFRGMAMRSPKILGRAIEQTQLQKDISAIYREAQRLIKIASENTFPSF